MSTPNFHTPYGGFQRVLTRVLLCGGEESCSMSRDKLSKLTALRSGRYPLFATEATTPNERRPPERLRTVAVVRAGRTACGDAFDFRVVICNPDSEL
jgi:hypothetical protein